MSHTITNASQTGAVDFDGAAANNDKNRKLIVSIACVSFISLIGFVAYARGLVTSFPASIHLSWETAKPDLSRVLDQSSVPERSGLASASSKSRRIAQIERTYGQLPMSFEANEGQTDPQVRFLSRGQGYGLFLTSTGAVLSLGRSATAPNDPIGPRDLATEQSNIREATTFRMHLRGAAGSARISGLEELSGKVNYFIGNEAESWRTNVPTYARVRYENIYPGVDLVYYGNQRQLEYDFVVAPGASVKSIRLSFDGANKVRLNRHGDLILTTKAGKLTLLRPLAYQEIDDKKRKVSSHYLLTGRGQVSFQVGSYDKSRPLVIDPVLVYSTYLGGSDDDQGNGIAVDSLGSVYITGQTSSLDFPAANSFQPTKGGLSDAFITKLNPAGSAIVYSTFLGGTSTDIGTSIALDGAGNAYVTGQTGSNNFPLLNPLHPTLGGSLDAFVAELNPSGSALIFSTFLGGTSNDGGNSVAVDAAGSAYVTGFSFSRDFPTNNALQANRAGNAAFKTLNGAGNWAASDTGLIASTVNSLTFDSGNSSTIYAATDTGIFKSIDAGINWTALGSQQTATPVNKIAINPTDSSILYAATAGGIFKSFDGGSNFTPINNGLILTFVRTIIVDPVTPTTLYATNFGSVVFKSTNAGDNWIPGFINGASLINDLVIDPNTPTTLYAATNGGIYKSTNAASSWTASNSGLPFNFNARAVAVDKTNNLLYAAASNGGIFKSANGGANWSSVNGNLPFGNVLVVALDPSTPSIIYLGTPFGLQKTIDGGVTWNPSGTGYPNITVSSLVVDPSNPSTLYLGTSSGSDGFVAKLSSGGGVQIYSTYLGGSGSESARGIVLDASGNSYLTGSTTSDNFPTVNALQPVKGTSSDVFVTKLSSTGSALMYSTFLGGDGNEVGSAIAVDENGNAYVAGTTSSTNFPTANAFQATNAVAFSNDAFVTKLNPAGSSLVYSTYLGGNGDDQSLSIAIDPTGSAYLTGSTSSTNFPTLGALQPAKNGFLSDAFVTKLAASGSALVYSTYLGGAGADSGRGISVDPLQSAYVVGTTGSANFPIVNALQASYGGSTDVFSAKLRPAPELAITMTDSPDPVSFGNNLTYTIDVKNNGELTATGVNLTDVLPPGATLVSAISTTGTCGGSGPVNCAIGALNSGDALTVTVVITPPAVRTITNTASISLNESDAFPTNNTAIAETFVDFADLSIVKNAAQSLIAPGAKLTFSLNVKNKGVVQASSVTVTDNLPAGTTLIKCTATGSGVCGGNGNNVSVLFPSLAVGASEAILLTVGVSGSANEGSVISNTASVSSSLPDPDNSNNSATVSVNVTATPVRQKSNGIIAFAADRAFTAVSEPSGIYTVNSDGTGEKLFSNIPLNARLPAWSPDGSRLAFQSTNFATSPVVSEVSIINADGTGILKIAENVSDFNRGFTWSPNGSQIAFIGKGQSNQLETIRTVYITNTDGSGTYRLPNSPTFLASVDWSPDGSKFVYATDREIFLMNADGTGQTQLTTIQPTPDGATTDSDPHWSPDGTKILLTRSTNNSNIVYLMNADGSGLTRLFNFGARRGAWSADGLAVVFEQGNEICTVNLDGTNFNCLTNNIYYDFTPNWQRLPNPNPTPTPTPAPSYSLSGRITSSDGLIPFAQVQLTGPLTALVGINVSGDFDFIHLPVGQYTVTPVSIFHSFSPQNHTVSITNSNVTDIDFVSTFVPANITGRVTDNLGNPLVGFKITSVGGFPQGSTLTDSNGFYSFPNVSRNRTYSIFIDPFTPYDFEPGGKVITNLTASEVVNFVGTKQPVNVISGRVAEAVNGQGIAGIQVNLGQDGGAAATTFADANGNFSFGERRSNHSYLVSIFFHPVYNFEPIQDAPTPFASFLIPALTSDQHLTFTGSRRNTVQFAAASVSVAEGSGYGEIVVTRIGDVNSAARINYATSDTAGLVGCNVLGGTASERCDYETTVGTLRFVPGETSKSFIIPIVDDVHVEGGETLAVTLSTPTGATLVSPSTATVTIADNDATPATQNPVDGVQFFVSEQYIDFLGRLPDQTGLANWMATLNGCPNGGYGENDNPGCDRVHVSAGFFLSDEFRGRGYWAYRFYEVGLDRRPAYAEFVPDMAQVGGPQSPTSEALSKASYTDDFPNRTEFKSRYDSLSNSAYVNALEQNAEITLANKAALIAALDANQKSRWQVLREIVESPAVEDRFFIRAFVAMQYFGYLRRDPDTIGYNNWVMTLTNNSSDYRHMIFGFLYSSEYRARFGPQ